MKLIDDADFAEIRQTINDVQETFYQLDVVYRVDSNIVTRWQRDVEDARAYDDKALKGLVVWASDTKNSETTQEKTGSYDFGEGYVLLAYDDCLTAGIIDGSKNLTVSAPRDKIKFNEVEYYVCAVVQVGQLKDTNCVIKVHFRKDLKKG